jgi:putative transposase
VVIQRLAVDVGNRLEEQVPADWLWFGRHVKIADGTIFSMPDTEANQKVYPQSRAQKPGLGFPLLRMMVLLSLATATLCGMALAPFAGKKTGESTLLRTLLGSLHPGDIVVGDRACGNYFLMALALKNGVDWLARVHQARKVNYRRSRYQSREERLVVWRRPQRPKWMDKATYATIPETLSLRQVVVDVREPGFRPNTIVLVSTLTDARHYSAQALADLYRARWNVELDLRALKQSMDMEPLRCKSPSMVRKEIWTHWLAYNLIRKTIAQAALSHGRLPRQISFAGARQTIAASWDRLSREPSAVRDLANVQCTAIASHRVGSRPNRVEPRAIKRRPKPHRLLQKPRAQARAELLRAGGRGG